MKKILALAVVSFTSQAITGFAGEPVVPSKEVVAPPAPIQELYRANEWQVDIFGAYAPAGRDGSRFLGDHAWGGGAGVNYFFTKYFGLGLEGCPQWVNSIPNRPNWIRALCFRRDRRICAGG